MSVYHNNKEYNEVVTVQNIGVDVEQLSVTENGTYTAPTGKSYNPVNVNVPTPEPTLQEKTVTANGDVTADEGYDGLSKVTVNVQGGGSEQFIGLIDRTATHIDIPQGTTKIGDYAFYNLTNLQSITIPNSVTSIGGYAFYKCENLQSITIPNSVTSIGKNAFYYCRSLESVTIPDSVTYIGNNAFNSCSLLTSVTLGNGVTSISDYTFLNCKSLTSINIPDSVTTIGSSAFQGCSGLTSVTLGNGVTSIGSSALFSCINLNSITVNANKAPTVTSSTFGYSETTYTGRSDYAKGTNVLKVPSGATGYNSSYWADPLLSSTKCGFHKEYL